MTLSTRLQQLRQQDPDLVLPLPPICQQVLTLARADGIDLTALYVLRQPLEPHLAGGYDRSSREAWSYYALEEGPDGLRRLVRQVLALLVCARERFPPPRTIDEDWDQVRRSHEEAMALAGQWNLGTWYPPEEALRRGARDQYHRRCHLAAGRLAGSTDPQIARRAFQTLQRLSRDHGWSEERLLALLEGVEENPLEWQDHLAMLGWPRLTLRAHWVLTSEQQDQHDWGRLARPMTLRAGRVLREALAQSSHLPALPTSPHTERQPWLLRLRSVEDLALALHLVQTWLGKEYPQAPLRLRCWGYGEADAPLRLYRLRLVYEHHPLVVREAWVLVEDPELVALEAAWQHLLASWLGFANWQQGTLTEGLQALWSCQRRPT